MMPDDDGPCCAHVELLTTAALAARGAVGFPHPFAAFVERVDGEIHAVAFTSIASAAEFLQAMAPDSLNLQTHGSDDRAALLALLNGARLHRPEQANRRVRRHRCDGQEVATHVRIRRKAEATS